MASSKSITEKFGLRGRRIVVTGGAMGIGYAITRDIAEMGGDVAVLDLLDQPLDDVYGLKKHGVKAAYFQADVSKEESLKAGFAKAVEALGGIDGLVTAAGIAIDQSFTDQSWDAVSNILQVNSLGTFFAAQLAANQMIKQGTPGSIVMIASISAHINLPAFRMAGYNMSKGGVKVLAKVLSSELGPKQIRVNSISPGFIETRQTRAVREQSSNPAADIMSTAPPLARIGQPEDVSPTAIYLLSDASSYVTGTDIFVTGGVHTGRGGDYEAA